MSFAPRNDGDDWHPSHWPPGDDYGIPSTDGSPLPNTPTTSYYPPSTSPTASVTSAGAQSDIGSPSASASSTQTSLTSQTPTSSQAENGEDKHHGNPPPIGALVIVPIALIIAAIVAFVWWRKRRAAKQNGGVIREKRMRSTEEGLTQGLPTYNESTGGLLMMTPSSATPLTGTRTNNSLAPAASRTNRASQPVILATNMGGAYFTGLDTSDAVSMASGAPNSDTTRRSIDVTSITSDEPPPPYRPRSVPPISREASLRNPGQNLSVNTALAPLSEGNFSRNVRDDDDDDATPTAETTPMRNPFDDPEDDRVSAMSTPVQSPRWRRGDDDARSMISEFSFEHEHR